MSSHADLSTLLFNAEAARAIALRDTHDAIGNLDLMVRQLSAAASVGDWTTVENCRVALKGALLDLGIARQGMRATLQQGNQGSRS